MATAIPKITDRFHAIDQVGWYGSAFFLTLAVFQSFWGKLYRYCHLKYTYLAAGVVFEVGSLVCGECMMKRQSDINADKRCSNGDE